MPTKEESKSAFITKLDLAASALVAEYPALDRLDVYNSLQVLSWQVLEAMKCQTGIVLAENKEVTNGA